MSQVDQLLANVLMDEACFKQGKRAAKLGLPYDSCPFHMPDFVSMWQQGYKKGLAEKLESLLV